MIEPENHTLALLREMRAEQQAFRQETRERFDRLENRIGAMHLNGVKALKGFIGHRSMVERTMASFEIDVAELKRQIVDLESQADG